MKPLLVLTFVSLFGLAACGQSGSLYLVGPNGERLSQQAARDLDKPPVEADAAADEASDAASEDGETKSTAE